MTAEPAAQLPDDIEQKLIDGQRLRATHDLMERRGITLNSARALVGRWLFERQRDRQGTRGQSQNAAGCRPRW